MANTSNKIALRQEVEAKYTLKPTITAPIVHFVGIVGEVDFTKITIEEIEAYGGLPIAFDKKKGSTIDEK